MIQLADDQVEPVLGAMVTVAAAGGAAPLSPADQRGIVAALEVLFGRSDVELGADLTGATSGEVAGAVEGEAAAELVRVLAVLALLDGVVEQPKLALVEDFATALRVHSEFVDDVVQLSLDHVGWVAHDLIRANVDTIPGVPWHATDPYGPFMPYHDNAVDPVLASRYEALADLPADSFGRRFADHYLANEYGFPGSPGAVVEAWATAHDSLHVLSGYGTSAQGEILVAAFTGGAFAGPVDFMATHVVPTILIYHLGIDINKGLNQGDKARAEADPAWRDNYSGNVHLGLDPRKLWVAVERGRAMTTDLYSGHWDFWEATEQPLDELRHRYGIPELPAADGSVADDDIDRSQFDRLGMASPPPVTEVPIRDRPSDTT